MYLFSSSWLALYFICSDSLFILLEAPKPHYPHVTCALSFLNMAISKQNQLFLANFFKVESCSQSKRAGRIMFKNWLSTLCRTFFNGKSKGNIFPLVILLYYIQPARVLVPCQKYTSLYNQSWQELEPVNSEWDYHTLPTEPIDRRTIPGVLKVSVFLRVLNLMYLQLSHAGSLYPESC